MLHGWADPISLLALPPDDFEIAAAIVREAQNQSADRERRHLEFLATYLRR